MLVTLFIDMSLFRYHVAIDVVTDGVFFFVCRVVFFREKE